MKAILRKFVLLWVVMVSVEQLNAQTPDANNILYVNGSATGSGTGNSWSNAVISLADALKYANDNKASYGTNTPLKIYVAKGTYKPAYSPQTFTNGGRQNSFLMVANVQLYGGFDPSTGINGLADARIYGTGGTILSGDVNDDDVISGSGSTLVITQNTENNFHIVISAGNVGSAILDGFTVTGGNSDNSASYVTVNGAYNVSPVEGGGMYIVESSPNIVKCTFTANRGYWYAGGMLNNNASPTLTDCTFLKNTVNGLGGGMYNSNSSPILNNCTFSGNMANNSNGGGVANYDNSSPVFNSCVFTANYGNQSGGVRNSYSSPTFTNCRFTSNSATSEGGAIHSLFSSSTITNCSFIGNFAGGGSALYGSNAAFIVNGSLFAGNFNTSGGTGIMLFTSQATLTNVTMARNGTTGLYAYGGGSTATIQNCVIWDEVVASGQGSSIGTYTSSHSIIKSKSDNTNGNIDATSLLPSNIFFDFANDNFTLKQNSPALNAGNNSLYLGLDANTKDLLGSTRLSGARIDMGAYEFQSTLPVVLVDFTAKADKNTAKLKWQTASEINNKGFIVFRSGDGKDFVRLTTQAPGFDGQSATYNYTDYSPLNGNNYYRLLQLDLDGKETDLGTRVLNFSLTDQEIRFYPNPVVDKLRLDFAAAQYQSLALIDISGRKLKEHKLQHHQGSCELEMGSYQKGIYFIEFRGVGGKKLIKILK